MCTWLYPTHMHSFSQLLIIAVVSVKRHYYSNTEHEGKRLLFLLYFESQYLLVSGGSWKWQETKEGSEAKMGSKLDWFMVNFYDMHFLSHCCLSEEKSAYTMKYPERVVTFHAAFQPAYIAIHLECLLSLQRPPQLFPNLPNVMLLSVMRFPWAVCLFPISSNLTNGVTYYEKLAHGWKFDTCSLSPGESLKKSL